MARSVLVETGRDDFGARRTAKQGCKAARRAQGRWAKIRRICYLADMDEGRKRVLLIAASILAARRLADWNGGPPFPKFVGAISDSIRIAERIMHAIDERWPESKANNSSNVRGPRGG